jgi:FtsP/CotA-like multicopper oxidase with cupredoxin domain
MGTPFGNAGAGTIWMTNVAPAPFPVGLAPMDKNSPFAEMNVVMRFDVSTANGTAIQTCGKNVQNSWDPAWTQTQMIQSIASGASCIPPNTTSMILDPKFQDIRPKMPFAAPTIVRQVYLNEKIDGTTLASLGLQLNGVPFEFKVTETPKRGNQEVWQFINTTGDAHPMHPHLVKHQIVARQSFNVGSFFAALCGSTTCQLGPAPGGMMQAIPDVTPFLTGSPVLVNAASPEGGWKDATQALPGMVTTIVADWTARWAAGSSPNAPGTAGCPNGTLGCPAPYTFEDVTSGPYVWHCHINSHEDSEMMHTSLVVP